MQVTPKGALWTPKGRVFQTAGTASAKALRQHELRHRGSQHGWKGEGGGAGRRGGQVTQRRT